MPTRLPGGGGSPGSITHQHATRPRQAPAPRHPPAPHATEPGLCRGWGGVYRYVSVRRWIHSFGVFAVGGCFGLCVWLVCIFLYKCSTFEVLYTLFTASCEQPNAVRAVAQRAKRGGSCPHREVDGFPPRFTAHTVGSRSQDFQPTPFRDISSMICRSSRRLFLLRNRARTVMDTCWLQGTSTHVSVFHLPAECDPLRGRGCLACLPTVRACSVVAKCSRVLRQESNLRPDSCNLSV
jgi:hypothetical protein